MVISLKNSSSMSTSEIDDGLSKQSLPSTLNCTTETGNKDNPPLVSVSSSITKSTCSKSSTTTERESSESASPSDRPSFEYKEASREIFEVNYRTDVTSLFTCIESCNWEEVSFQCMTYPSHVRTWVISTGTEDPSSWCVWRRLPIHEACRRQPPVQIIQELLNIFPESAHEKTQFGELPIHLAAGCGAGNDILNLLIAFNPLAVLVRDNGGRTPLEIIKSSYPSDTSILSNTNAAFLGCQSTLLSFNKRHQNKVEQIRGKHAKEISLEKTKTDEEFKTKEDNIAHLKKKLHSHKRQITELICTMQQCEDKIMEKNQVESKLMDRVYQLEKENSTIRTDNKNLKIGLREEHAEVEEKNEKIKQLSQVISTLLRDMQSLVQEKDKMLLSSRKWEKDATDLIEKQQKINAEMLRQRHSFKSYHAKIAKNLDHVLDTNDFTEAWNNCGERKSGIISISTSRSNSMSSRNRVSPSKSPIITIKEEKLN